ncbi:MAG: response regulator [Chitinophagaceae bacterium]|nr:MAG: response regulator [Chitinophagaceae bacterium]
MKKKVYILEDDPDLRDILAHVLGKEYEIGMSEELDVSDVVVFQPDLILMDHGIGNSTSEQNIRSLKNNIPGFGIPIILFSGHPDISRLAIDPLVAGIIRKPAGISEVRAHLESFFSTQ